MVIMWDIAADFFPNQRLAEKKCGKRSEKLACDPVTYYFFLCVCVTFDFLFFFGVSISCRIVFLERGVAQLCCFLDIVILLRAKVLCFLTTKIRVLCCT